jgi:hypothetical protein
MGNVFSSDFEIIKINGKDNITPEYIADIIKNNYNKEQIKIIKQRLFIDKHKSFNKFMNKPISESKVFYRLCELFKNGKFPNYFYIDEFIGYTKYLINNKYILPSNIIFVDGDNCLSLFSKYITENIPIDTHIVLVISRSHFSSKTLYNWSSEPWMSIINTDSEGKNQVDILLSVFMGMSLLYDGKIKLSLMTNDNFSKQIEETLNQTEIRANIINKNNYK